MFRPSASSLRPRPILNEALIAVGRGPDLAGSRRVAVGTVELARTWTPARALAAVQGPVSALVAGAAVAPPAPRAARPLDVRAASVRAVAPVTQQAIGDSVYVWFDLGQVLLDASKPGETRYMPGALEYLEELRSQGFKIGLITNIPAEWGQPGDKPSKIAALDKFIRDNWVDGVPPLDLSSFDEVLVPLHDSERKPAEKLFVEAMAIAGKAGRASYFAGETGEEVDVARRVGMAGYQITYDEGRPVYQEPARIVEEVESPRGGARDPMTHIRALSRPAMAGRGSPSAGLDAAARYLVDFARRHGLSGPNPNDPQGPYTQTFKLYRFSAAAPAHEHEAPSDKTEELYQHGFSVGTAPLSPEDVDLIAERWAAADPAAAARFRALASRPGLEGDALRTGLEALAPESKQVQNVVAMLPGTGPRKDEVIVVMAHYDHVGARGSRVYHGADDNASGTSVVLSAIPELVAAQKRGELDRSILFVWTAAEELGLVGASHLARNPLPGIPNDRIAGVLNFDMVGRWDEERLSVLGNRNGSSLSRLVEAANEGLEDPFDNLHRDIEEYRRRQDGWVFERMGKDVVFVFEGLSNPRGGGRINPDYHRTTDTYEAILGENGGDKPRKVRDFAQRLIVLASNQR